MESRHMRKPVPLAQKEISDTIQEVQETNSKLKKSDTIMIDPDHKALADAVVAGGTANILNLRLSENILYEMQSSHSDNYVQWGKFRARGAAAFLFAIVAALALVYYCVQSKLVLTERDKAIPHESIQ